MRRSASTDAPRPAATADPLPIASVVDQVYVAIRARIASGALRRGSRVHQEDLAADLGVSRTPVREALRRLSAEGLVEMRTNRGARVADIDRGDMSTRRSWRRSRRARPGARRRSRAATSPARSSGSWRADQRSMRTGLRSVPTPPTSISTTSPSRR